MSSEDHIVKQLTREIASMHQQLTGVSPAAAKLQYIIEAQELEGYGLEYYPVKVFFVSPDVCGGDYIDSIHLYMFLKYFVVFRCIFCHQLKRTLDVCFAAFLFRFSPMPLV